jgi:DNA-binding transcriptional ArsR family regulator
MKKLASHFDVLSQLVGLLPLPHFLTETDGKVVACNPPACERIGLPAGEIRGRVLALPDSPGQPAAAPCITLPPVTGLEWRRADLFLDGKPFAAVFWLDCPSGGRDISISKRGRMILGQLALGHTVREISAALGLQQATVRTHIFRLRQALGSCDLTTLRFQAGLLAGQGEVGGIVPRRTAAERPPGPRPAR